MALRQWPERIAFSEAFNGKTDKQNRADDKTRKPTLPQSTSNSSSRK
jgi:hypothetical protein